MDLQVSFLEHLCRHELYWAGHTQYSLSSAVRSLLGP